MLKELLDKLVGKLPGIDSLVNLPTTISNNLRFIVVSVVVVTAVVVLYNVVT